MASIGNSLREARQRKGLSLADVEEMTKIRTHYLKALEDESFELLPGNTYVVGFLRTYARTLGLDAQELVQEFKATSAKPEEVIKPVEPLTPQRRPAVPRGLLITGLCILALITLFGVDSVWKSARPAQQKPPTTTPAATQPEKPQPKPVPSVTPPTVTPQVSGLSLDLKFSARCWLEIKADGQQVFRGFGDANTTKNFKANNSIELVSVGNTGGVSLVLNGKPLPPLGGPGQTVHNKILTSKDIPQ